MAGVSSASQTVIGWRTSHAFVPNEARAPVKGYWSPVSQPHTFRDYGANAKLSPQSTACSSFCTSMLLTLSYKGHAGGGMRFSGAVAPRAALCIWNGTRYHFSCWGKSAATSVLPVFGWSAWGDHRGPRTNPGRNKNVHTMRSLRRFAQHATP